MAKRRSVTEQAKRLTDGQINRRRFIMSAVASGVTLPTATALATKAEARVPRQGGLLRIATAANADTFLAHATGNTLTRLTSDGRVAGELAASLKVSDDHLNWTATLRDGVAFQDGAPLTADSVLESFHDAGFFDGTVEAQDDRTLLFSLKRPIPNFPRHLADARNTLRHDKTGSTTGGYIVTGGDSATTTLTRNPTYWKPNAAHFDTVEILTLPDHVERHRAVMTGAVTYADEIDPKVIATLKGLPTLDILETKDTHHLGFPMRSDVAPFDDPELRAQLATVIDGDAVLQSVALGHGSTKPTARKNITPTHVTAPLLFHVSEEALPGSLRAAEIIKQQAESQGLTISIVNATALEWPSVRANAGWYATRGVGAPSPDAIPGLSLNALAAHSTLLAHPARVSTLLENDGYRITDRWWFEGAA